MESVLAPIIIILGAINALRMATFMILGDVYDQRFYSRKFDRRSRKYRPFISVIIPAFNEERSIYSCLQSVGKSSYRNFEIVVVDDGSKDQTCAVVQQFIQQFKPANIRLIMQPNRGKAGALNNAIQNHATGRLIMILDADSNLDKNALQNAIRYFRDRKVVAMASNVRIIKQKSLLAVIQYIEYLMGYRLKKAFTVLGNEYIIGGIGSLFRKSVLKLVRYYDTDTMTEDIDLTLKIAARGNRKRQIIYASDVLCFTQAVPSIPDLFRQRFRWKYGRFQSLWKSRQLFFNHSVKYTKLLTFFQLPFVLYSEFIFLLDPILIFYLIYLEIRYRDFTTLASVLLFFATYTFIAILTDEHTSPKEKIPYLLLTPAAYLFFLLVGCVEYIALIKSIRKNKGIFAVEREGTCQWAHVRRI